MDLRERILKEYALAEKQECKLDCFVLERRRYLVFWDTLITRDSVDAVLHFLHKETGSPAFSKWKTLIVVGKTDDSFAKEELLFFNGVSTFAVFLLLNEKEKRVFTCDSWIFALGCNFRKHVRKIVEILKE